MDNIQFKRLIKKRNRMSVLMTSLISAVYFSFILMVAYAKGILGLKLTGNVPLGILLGVGIIIFSWILTGVHVWWANIYYDKEVEKIKSKI